MKILTNESAAAIDLNKDETFELRRASVRQCVSSDEAEIATKQHVKPCGDCPWRRKSLNGWLGSMSKEGWILVAHSDSTIECHTQLGAQCAGAAIYRANTCKLAYPPNLKLKPDHEVVFSNRNEFFEHHSRPPALKKK